MKLNVKALKEVEIGIPIITKGIYHARIEDPKVEPNKRGDGNNLVLKFRILDNPVVLHKDGKEIVNNGQVVIMRYFGLTPSEKRDPDKDMKELAVAIKNPPEADLNVDDLKDKVVMIGVEYKAAEEGDANATPPKKAYPEGNEIKRITPLKEDDTFTPPPF